MRKKPKHVPEPVDEVEELYDQAMADIYDTMVESYDKIGVRVKELLEAVEYLADNVDEDEVDDLEEDDEVY